MSIGDSLRWLKRPWRGEERLWKVFWLYGLPVIFIGFIIASAVEFGSAMAVGVVAGIRAVVVTAATVAPGPGYEGASHYALVRAWGVSTVSGDISARRQCGQRAGRGAWSDLGGATR